MFIFSFNNDTSDKNINMHVGYINSDFNITYNQSIIILEALNAFIGDIQKLNPKSIVSQKRNEFKIKEVNKLFEYMQNQIGYNFNDKCEKCQRALSKPQDDIGGDAMELAVKYSKKKIKKVEKESEE